MLSINTVKEVTLQLTQLYMVLVFQLQQEFGSKSWKGLNDQLWQKSYFYSATDCMRWSHMYTRLFQKPKFAVCLICNMCLICSPTSHWETDTGHRDERTLKKKSLAVLLKNLHLPARISHRTYITGGNISCLLVFSISGLPVCLSISALIPVTQFSHANWNVIKI